jgi:hypothetical protein
MSELAVQFFETVHLLIRPALIGVWKLKSFTEATEGTAETHPLGPGPVGFLIYTNDGYVSAQLMNPSRSMLRSGEWNDGTPEEFREIGTGYIGYSGRFRVDEEHAVVTHIPEVSLFPNFVGNEQKRLVDLDVDSLTLTTFHKRIDGRDITSRLEWLRVLIVLPLAIALNSPPA